MKKFLRAIAPGLIIPAVLIGAALMASKPAAHTIDATSTVKVIVYTQDGEEVGHGSGVILQDGTVLTANHVVDHEGLIYKVQLQGAAPVESKVLWQDKAYDVAILSQGYKGVTGSALECKQHVYIGQRIEAVGNPLELHFVHSWGRISSLEYAFDDDWKSAAITDLTIAPGSSGGPAFGEDGKVVGITVGVAIIPIQTMLGAFPNVSGYSIIIPSTTICALIQQHSLVATN